MSKLIHKLVKNFDTSCHIRMIQDGFVIRFNLFVDGAQLIKLLIQIFETKLIISKKINGKSKDVLITEIPECFETDLRKMRQRIFSPIIIIIKKNLIILEREDNVVYIDTEVISIVNNIELFYDYLYTDESINNKIMNIIKES